MRESVQCDLVVVAKSTPTSLTIPRNSSLVQRSLASSLALDFP